MSVGGERLIDRVASALRETTEEVLLVANDPGADRWLPGVRRIADARPGLGPLGGIHAALGATTGPVLVVAWDMPFVPPTLLARLRRLGDEGYSAVVAESAPNRLEPTCALYARSCRAELEQWLNDGGRSATDFLGQLPHVRILDLAELSVFGDPQRMFFSVNTTASLARAEALAVRR